MLNPNRQKRQKKSHSHLSRVLMFSKGAQLGLLWLIMTFALVGCGLELAGPAAPQTALPLRVAVSDWPGDFPMIIAKETGLFEKYGVDVELVYYQDYAAAVADFTAGKVDTLNITLADALKVVVRTPIKVVAQMDVSEGADAIVGVAGLNNPADLEGKRIGVDLGAVMGEFFIEQMFAEYNLTRDMVTLVNVPVEDVPAQLGVSIDAGHTWEPFVTQARDLGANVLFTSAETPGLFPDLMAFRQVTVEQRPLDIQALILAWDEAVAFFTANPQGGNEIVAAYFGIAPEDISLEGVRLGSISVSRLALIEGNTTASLFYTSRLMTDYLVKIGDLAEVPDFDALFDPQFLR